jgi:hypothetical protein
MISVELLLEFLRFAFETDDPHEIRSKTGWVFDFGDTRQQIIWSYPDRNDKNRHLDVFDGQTLQELIRQFNEFLVAGKHPYRVRIVPGAVMVLKGQEGWIFVTHQVKVGRRKVKHA